MCGIAVVVGPGASRTAFRGMLDILKPRGEVEEVALDDGLLAGTQRLRIVDRERAVQPWISADGRWLLCFNGEIFNYRGLRDELRRLGQQFRSDSDTEVVLEAFTCWGEEAVRRLRGEFAFVIADRFAGRIYLARDRVGVKPLYWSASADCVHVASEIKALVPVGEPIFQVPAGCHGWAVPGGVPEFARYAGSLPLERPLIPDPRSQPPLTPDPLTPGLPAPELPAPRLLSSGTPNAGPPINDPDEAAALVRASLQDSIRVRLDTDLTVGVILSGGLDSSLTLLHVRALHPDCVAFTVGAPGSEDIAYARRLTAELDVPHEVIEISPRDIHLADIREAIRIAELTEYGDIINAVVSVPLFKRIANLGVKIVLTGDGSDELFGGYPMYHQIGAEQERRLFLHKIANLHRTELQRVDRVSMAYGVEARVPFLDQTLVELAMRLPMDLKVRDGVEKWILREAFSDILPGYIKRRPKNPMSHSSGLHERARMYKPLFARIHRSFGYDLHEPVRRDFSTLLRSCGNNLDLAIQQAQGMADYSPREHARDLIGAARWNAVTLVGSRGTAQPS
jgi:asparagine synthase (glutamine-hydrolysing)